MNRIRDPSDRKDVHVAGKIQWETDLKKALKRAESEVKFVLIFFHNPG